MNETTKQQIFALYDAGIGGPTIGKQLEINIGSIYTALYSRGEPLRTFKQCQRPLDKTDHNYFSELNPTKAYFVGLLAADGQIQKHKHASSIVRIDLKEDDDILIKTLKKEVQCSALIKYYKYGNQKNRAARLVIFSDQMALALSTYGIVPRKTFEYAWPQKIPLHLESDFIRGYFDGDGCITVGPCFKLVGTKSFLLEMQKKLMNSCLLRQTKLQERWPERKTNIRSLEYAGRFQVERIYKYLYSSNGVHLPRKKKRFEELINGSPKSL